MDTPRSTHTRAYLTTLVAAANALSPRPSPPRSSSPLPAPDSGAWPSSARTPTTATLEAAALAILTSNDEDDQPERLKDLLQPLLPNAPNLDDIVLQLLHRHREDVRPTGQSFDTQASTPQLWPVALPSPSTTPGTSPIRRSSSLRRTYPNNSSASASPVASHAAATLALNRNASSLLLNPLGSVSANGSRPASPSPLRSASPGPTLARSFGIATESSSPTHERSAIPSPRVLHATASEFRPGSISNHVSRSSTPALTGNSTTSDSRNVWAFSPSPLGTPKFASSLPLPASASLGLPPAAAESYFNLSSVPISPSPSGTLTPGGKTIPRDPWHDEDLSTALSSQLLIAANDVAVHPPPVVITNSQGENPADDAEQVAGDWATGQAGMSPEFAHEVAKFGSWDPFDVDPFEDPNRLRGSATGTSGRVSPALLGGRVSPGPIGRAPSPSPLTGNVWASHDTLDSTYSYPLSSTGSFMGLSGQGGGYSMTPFDELYAAVAGTGISSEEMEEALAKCGFDPMEAVEYLIRRSGMPNDTGMPNDRSGSTGSDLHLSGIGVRSGDSPSRTRTGTVVPGNSRGATIVGRDNVFRPNPIVSTSASMAASGGGGRSPMASAPTSPRWSSARPLTPVSTSGSNGVSAASSGDRGGPSHRVCRFYLQGGCLRSDCRFSHDVGKAVCRFWLRGHCLKGEHRCDFLHEIPDIANARLAMMDAKNEYRRGPSWNRVDGGGNGSNSGMYDSDDERSFDSSHTGHVVGASQPHQGDESIDFPSLSDSGDGDGRHLNIRSSGPDPSRTRWSGVVKGGSNVRHSETTAIRQPVDRRSPRYSSSHYDVEDDEDDVVVGVESGGGGGGQMGKGSWKSRASQRLGLRPPALMPTLPTGSALAQLYGKYREGFLDMGHQRNKCFQKANECFRRGDGAGAKRWSREGDDWNRRVIEEGRHAASSILSERNRQVKDAIISMERLGKVESGPDRMHRGREVGGGVCLGVASYEIVGKEGKQLNSKERMEVMMDLHGLHPSEAIDFLERFLLSLQQDGYVGLAFVVVGEGKHTGTSDPARGSGRVRLGESVMEYLAGSRYAWKMFDGVLCIDPCR